MAGQSPTTAGQVKRTAQETGLPETYICYGYAIYLDEGAFIELHRDLGQDCDYGAMRQEVAEVCFLADPDFSMDQVIAYGMVWGGGAGHDGDLVGADFGGDASGGDGAS